MAPVRALFPPTSPGWPLSTPKNHFSAKTHKATKSKTHLAKENKKLESCRVLLALRNPLDPSGDRPDTDQLVIVMSRETDLTPRGAARLPTARLPNCGVAASDTSRHTLGKQRPQETEHTYPQPGFLTRARLWWDRGPQSKGRSVSTRSSTNGP